MIDYSSFLEQCINDGIEAAKNDYTKPEDQEKLEGSIAGFEECRGKSPEELIALYSQATKKAFFPDRESKEMYWYFRCYELEVIWICNLVSARALLFDGEPLFCWLPTYNAMKKVVTILNLNHKLN